MSDPVFGDAEPEDAWDPDDELEVCVDNLRRRLALLGEELDPYGDPALDLAELAELLPRARARTDLTPRDALRLRHLEDDLELTQARLR